MVPVPVYPADIDVTPSPAVKVLLIVSICSAVVFVALALTARRWVRVRSARVLGAVCLGLMVCCALAAFVVDRATMPGIERASEARADEKLALRTQAADALGAAYGVTIDPIELMYVYTGSAVRVTLPDGDEETCTLGADDVLTLTCPRPLPRDPATADG